MTEASQQIADKILRPLGYSANCTCTACVAYREQAGDGGTEFKFREPIDGAAPEETYVPLYVPQDIDVKEAIKPGSTLATRNAPSQKMTPEEALALMDQAVSHLPASALDRKNLPVATGFIDYFPDAIAAVAGLSKIGNDQHNPGKPLHWDRSKSGDEGDALMRHFLDRGTVDTDGVRHSTKVAWRALALLQKEIEADRK